MSACVILDFNFLFFLQKCFPFFTASTILARHLPICLTMMKFLSIVPQRKESEHIPYEPNALVLAMSWFSKKGKCNG